MIVTKIGWAVVHALWQITAIGGVAVLALALLRRRSAEARHAAAWTGLVLMVAVPVVTGCLGETTVGWQIRRAVVTSVDRGIDLNPVVERLPSFVRDAAVFWLLGAVVGLVHLARAWRRAGALRHSRTTAVGSRLRDLVDDVASTMGFAPRLDVRHSSLVSGPVVTGWRRPTLLLPEGALDHLSSAELRSVVAHELAHVRRGDFAANMLQSVLDRLLFFHPVAWWISTCIREEREYCCDDAAIAVAPDATCLAHALAALEDARAVDGLAVAAASGTLLHRIQRIAGRSPRGLAPARALVVLVTSWALAAILLALVIIVPPSLPPGAKLRRRAPAPSGATATDRGAARLPAVR
jgi:beta-lactamase regulating signal transducer with metallopeptidase domain